MKCPICDIEMRIADREGVEIDYCPQCRGIWLDRGELEKILARVESQQSRGRDEEDDEGRSESRRAGGYRDGEPRPGDQYRRETEGRSGGKRREGFLSNLFEMFED